ncbi:MAG: hypothetical protein F4X44_11305 [Gammaproteobacteria bacterium]|nr:hypothetical protein [Gammaproteobacteria bacterium]MYD81185.1 hypothetical protein [Gammaproteobacteria bacterium]
MPEKSGDTNETRESNVSRWILIGGIFVLVVSVCLLFAGAFIAQRDRGYETESLSSQATAETLTQSTSHDHDHDHHNSSDTYGSTSTSDTSTGDKSASVSNPTSEESKASKSLLSDPSVMWEHVDEGSVDEADVPDWPRVITNRALVRMNSSVWTTTEGHRVQFPIPQRDIVLVGEVTEVSGTPLAPTLKGEVTDDGKNFPFTLTLSDDRAFATVSTSTGNYEMFSNRDYGWVMTREEMNAHIDYSVPHSFIENPDPHAGHNH